MLRNLRRQESLKVVRSHLYRLTKLMCIEAVDSFLMTFMNSRGVLITTAVQIFDSVHVSNNLEE
jgi:hypothetical protein